MSIARHAFLAVVAFVGIVAGLGFTHGVDGKAHAGYLSQSTFSCPSGTGAFMFGLPIDSEPTLHLYYYNIDGGAWQTTSWYYTDGVFGAMYWSGSSWEYQPADSSMTTRIIGGGHTVEAWELKYTYRTQQWEWVYFGSCQTFSFSDGGWLILNSAGATQASVGGATNRPGDANCDDAVNSLDSAFILQFAAGLVEGVPCAESADFNRDGTVNSIDSALVLQVSAGLIDAPQPADPDPEPPDVPVPPMPPAPPDGSPGPVLPPSTGG